MSFVANRVKYYRKFQSPESLKISENLDCGGRGVLSKRTMLMLTMPHES